MENEHNPHRFEGESDADFLLRTALDVAALTLRSGGEIHRVEETIRRICSAFGADHTEVFAIHSQIIASVRMKDGAYSSQVRRIYENYIDTHQQSALYFISHVRLFAGKILNHSGAPDFAVDSTDQLIVESAVIGNLCRLLAEKLMLLEGKNLEDGGSIEIERR